MAQQAPSTQGAVLSMGEILIDVIADDGATSLETAETFVARSGGAPANAAVALSRLGVQSAFCGVAGADPLGSRLRNELEAEHVDTSRLRQTNHEATTLAFAWKDIRGDGHFWLVRGADSLLDVSDVEAAGIADLAALVIGSVSLSAQPSRQAIERAVALANAAGVPVVFDVNLRSTLWADLTEAVPICEQVASQSNVVKLSLDDAIGLYGSGTTPERVIAHMLRLEPRAVILTDGERGCWLATEHGSAIRFVPAVAVDAIEPTGAGDAFSAALIARLISADWATPTIDDVRYAATAGALATTRRGAWEGLPHRAQLDAFIAANRS